MSNLPESIGSPDSNKPSVSSSDTMNNVSGLVLGTVSEILNLANPFSWLGLRIF